MLGKLLKHEFRYNLKKFIPLYIAYAAVAAVMRILMLVMGTDGLSGESTNIQNESLEFALSMSLMLLMIAFIFGAFGLSLYTIFGNVSRFHKNLFTDEGYLMNTLPVPSYSHILCKLISGLVWYAITSIVVVAGCFVAFVSSDDFAFFPSELISELLEGNIADTIMTYVLSIITYCAFLLLCYMGEGISSMTGGKKGISVLIVIGCIILNSIVTTIITTVVLSFADSDTSYTVYNGIKLIYYCIVSVGLFFLTNLIIKEHLNLE